MISVRMDAVYADPATPGHGWCYTIVSRAQSLAEGRVRGLERLRAELGAELSELEGLCAFALHVPGVSTEKPPRRKRIEVGSIDSM